MSDRNGLIERVKQLARLPENKKCSECGQRGPTYINCTIGCFVCTKCSGLLRGLNPPHRIKSCGLSTFTLADVQLLEANGNHVVEASYMATYDERCQRKTDDKDSPKFKEFLEEKYEKKMWFQPYTKSAKRDIKRDNPETVSRLDSRDISVGRSNGSSVHGIAIPRNRPPSRSSSVRSRTSSIQDGPFHLPDTPPIHPRARTASIFDKPGQTGGSASLAGDSGVTPDFEVDFDSAFGANNNVHNETVQQITNQIENMSHNVMSHNPMTNAVHPFFDSPTQSLPRQQIESQQSVQTNYLQPNLQYQQMHLQHTLNQPQTQPFPIPPPDQPTPPITSAHFQVQNHNSDRYAALAQLDTEVKQTQMISERQKVQRQMSVGQAIFGAPPSGANPFLTKSSPQVIPQNQNPFAKNPFL